MLERPLLTEYSAKVGKIFGAEAITDSLHPNFVLGNSMCDVIDVELEFSSVFCPVLRNEVIFV